jgi:GNAT superfamily N-acetyltransferase
LPGYYWQDAAAVPETAPCNQPNAAASRRIARPRPQLLRGPVGRVRFSFEIRVPLKFRDATPDDAAAIAGLQNAAADALTARFGPGPWSSLVNERGAALAQRHARVRIGRDGKHILTVLRLATKKPWAIDVSYFTPVKRPLYLTGMAVSVAHQGQGLGSLALEDACTIAQAWPADAIRLDAYDAKAGAGGFYARRRFTERGRVVYKGNPLVYYELVFL